MDYPRAQGTLLMCYSPFRRANCSPKGTFALDLHGLATPPAFVLSQDQTLHLIIVLLEPEGPISSMVKVMLVVGPEKSDWSARRIKDTTDQAITQNSAIWLNKHHENFESGPAVVRAAGPFAESPGPTAIVTTAAKPVTSS